MQDSDDKDSSESEESLQSGSQSEEEDVKPKQSKTKKKMDPFQFESQDVSSSEKEQVKKSRKRKAKVESEPEDDASSDDSAEVPENVFPSEEEDEDDTGNYNLEEEQQKREEYSFKDVRVRLNFFVIALQDIQKILAHRKSEETDQTEYFVKWANHSWMHCSWVPEKFVLKSGEKKLKQYQTKPTVVEGADPAKGVYFNPRWTEIDRIIDRRHKTLRGVVKYDYLVKWCDLGWEESTWEPSFFILVRKDCVSC